MREALTNLGAWLGMFGIVGIASIALCAWHNYKHPVTVGRK